MLATDENRGAARSSIIGHAFWYSLCAFLCLSPFAGTHSALVWARVEVVFRFVLASGLMDKKNGGLAQLALGFFTLFCGVLCGSAAARQEERKIRQQ